MIDYTRGGRGKVAPYETSHSRLPIAVKPLCERISTVWKKLFSLNDPKLSEEFIRTIEEAIEEASQQDNKTVNRFKSKDEALAIAKKILSQRKSAKVSLAKLLTAIYGIKIKPEDLEGVEK